MQGMRFLILNEEGMVNNGVITQRVTEERYMCTFMRSPQLSRLCHVDEISQWNLFPNDEALQAFANALQQQQPADPNTPPDGIEVGEPTQDTPPKPSPVKKKAAKKKARKQRSKRK